ncbi:MAG: RHS repeat-associated core domain-containing protein [bacterium]
MKNLGESPLHNLNLSYESEYQPEYTFPEGIIVDCGTPRSELGPHAAGNLNFSVRAQDSAPDEGTIALVVRADEGDQEWERVTVNYTFKEAVPVMKFTPSFLNIGVQREHTETASINLKNTGLSMLNDISVSLHPQESQPELSWIKLGVASDQGDLSVGKSLNISIVFQPGSDVPDGVYEYRLRIGAGNCEEQNINLYATVTSSETGDALMHIWDMYSGTDDGQGGTITGLKGSSITLQHSQLLHLLYTGVSDEYGEYLFKDLPTGKYNWRVSASRHDARSGTLYILPGITATEKVFLESKLVTVEWEVVPTVIEDKYEVKITTTFETDVPAAVVVVKPAGITLPDMEVGQVYNGELTLTNHGLVQAKEMNCTFPESDQYYDYQPLAAIPETLDAKQQIIVPYRITCLAKLGEESAESSGGTGGGGGYNYQKPICFDYCYTPCFYESENIVCDTICSLISKIKVDKESIVGGQEAEPISVIIAGNAKGGGHRNEVVSEGPKAQELGGSEESSCEEPCPYKHEPSDSDEPGPDICIFSGVTLPCCSDLGGYFFPISDLPINLNNNDLTVTRIYENNRWVDSHEKNTLSGGFNCSVLAHEGLLPPYHYLDKSKVRYKLSGETLCRSIPDADGPRDQHKDFVYVDGSYTIRTVGGRYDHDGYYDWDGYIWRSPSGEWKEYDKWGHEMAFGHRNNTNRVEFIYEGTGEAKQLMGIKDATGRQILWYERNEDNSIRAVYDFTGRHVEYTGGARPTKVTDVLGNEWHYTYDESGRITSKTDPLDNTVHINYYSGKVESVLDDNGNGQYYTFRYDSTRAEYYANVVTSEGMRIERHFNEEGRIIKELINGELKREIIYENRTRTIKTPAGTTIKKFDEWGNLIYIQNPDGTSHSYLYNRYSDLLEETNERGVVTRYSYDNRGNRIKMIEAAGTEYERITHYTYDEQGKGNLECITLPDGSEIRMEYDDYDHMIKITDAENNIIEYTYDDVGNIISKKDADENVWQYEYDKKNHLILETDPLYYETKYEYDAVGNLSAIIDAQDNRTEYAYDSHHKIKEIKDALGGIIRYEYNADGNLIENTDQMNNNTRYEYDDRQRRSTLTDPAENDIKYDYSDAVSCSSCASGGAVDQPSTIIYPTYTKHLEYDPMGRVVKEVDVLDENTSHETLYTYDAVGNLIEKTDPERNTTTYEYDVLNRLIKVTDAENGVTQYGYDIRDNLISVTDAEENITMFSYDRNGNKINERRHLGQEVSYGYDARGNLSSVIDAKNQKAVYNYDAAKRLSSIEYYSSSGNPMSDKTVTFDYDELGNVISYNDGITSATYTYDDLSRKLSETVNFGDFTLSYSYAYNPDGKKKSFKGPDDVTSDYSYIDGQLSIIHLPQVGDITFGEYDWLSPTRVNLPGGTVMNLDYDPLQRIKEIQSQDASNDIFIDYTYTRDTLGNVLSKATERGSYTYSYDKTYQLLSAGNPLDTTINDEAYTYNKIGNRLTASSQQGGWNYNENNQLTSIDDISFQYDENGNMIQKVLGGEATNYIYDIEDRLIQVEDGNGLIIGKYYYDPFGRRLWKEVGNVKTYFFYSDEGLIGEYNASGNEIRSYSYAPDSMWTTDPLFQKSGGTYYFYQNDHLGTPQKIIDASGDVVWAGVYNSFGNCEIIVEEIENNLRLPGQYCDEETGLYNNWNRYFEPAIGRYISIDPIGFWGGDNNLYRYVNNNPINFIDPFGLSKTIQCGPCKIIIDTDPHKGKHAHWRCHDGSKGCIKPNGKPCEKSGPPPNRVRKCLDKEKFFKPSECEDINTVPIPGQKPIPLIDLPDKPNIPIIIDLPTIPKLFPVLHAPNLPLLLIILPPELRADPSFPLYDPSTDPRYGGGT